MRNPIHSLILVVFLASAAYATDYNPLTDWVDAPGTPQAWSYGGRIETGYATGVFGDLIPADHIPDIWTAAPNGDGWTVPDTANTCTMWWKDPWQAKPGPIMNSWTTYQATARVYPTVEGIYDLAFSFEGTGYAAEGTALTKVYVVKNGSDILWSNSINDYSTTVGDSFEVGFLAGDYLDFISGNGSDAGESRSSLVADLNWNRVPEPATMLLLGMGGIALLRRKRA